MAPERLVWEALHMEAWPYTALGIVILTITPILALLGAVGSPRQTERLHAIIAHPSYLLVSYVMLRMILGVAEADLRTWLPSLQRHTLGEEGRMVVLISIVAFALIILIDAVVVILWPVVLKRNKSVWICLVINGIALSAYVGWYIEPSLVVTDIFGHRLVLVRYVLWNHTMTLIVNILNQLVESPVTDHHTACWRVFQSLVCLQAGLYGSLDLGSWALSATLIAVSQLMLTTLCYSSYQELRASTKFRHQRTVLGTIVFLSWHVFPLIWALAAFDVITPFAEEVAYSFFDVVVKVLCTTTIVQGHVKEASDDLQDKFTVAQASRDQLQDDLRAMIAVAAVPIIVLDAEGNVSVWNQHISALSGVRREDAEGQPLWSVPNIDEESASAAREAVGRVLANRDAGVRPSRRKAQGVSVIFHLSFERPNTCRSATSSEIGGSEGLGDGTPLGESINSGSQSLSGSQGTTYILITCTVTRDHNGTVTGLICLGADLTSERERMAIEGERAKMEAMSEAKDKFLACMSHEMRTPLSALMGLLQLIQGKPDEAWHRGALEPLINSAYASAEHLYMLVSDVLDLTKVQHGKLTLQNAPFDLHAVVGCVAHHCRHVLATLGPSRADVRVLVDMGSSPRVVRGDAQRMQQVLTNLGSNAVKYTPRGSVTLRLSGRVLDPEQALQAGLRRPDDEGVASQRSGKPVRVTLSVVDTGVGIPEGSLQRIFELFETGDAVNAPSAGIASASGIGLTICKELVAAMGGKLTVESAVGAGSVFTVTLDTLAYDESELVSPQELPDALNFGASARLHHASIGGAPRHSVRDASEPQGSGADSSSHPWDAAQPAARVQARPARVLLVEDDDMNRMVISLFLESHTVLEAHNGLEAVVIAHHMLTQDGEAPDMVIMDVNMPQLNGQDAARLIRRMGGSAAPWAARLPIVGLTASALDVELKRCSAAGMTTALTKPVTQSALLQLVHGAARLRRGSGTSTCSQSPPFSATPVHVPALDIETAFLLCDTTSLLMTAITQGAGVRQEVEHRMLAILRALRWATGELDIDGNVLSEMDALVATMESATDVMAGESLVKDTLRSKSKQWLALCMQRASSIGSSDRAAAQSS